MGLDTNHGLKEQCFIETGGWDLRRGHLGIIARWLLWIGGVGILGSFLVKTLFQYTLGGSPVYFLLLLLGILLYILSRVIG